MTLRVVVAILRTIKNRLLLHSRFSGGGDVLKVSTLQETQWSKQLRDLQKKWKKMKLKILILFSIWMYCIYYELNQNTLLYIKLGHLLAWNCSVNIYFIYFLSLNVLLFFPFHCAIFPAAVSRYSSWTTYSMTSLQLATLLPFNNTIFFIFFIVFRIF